MQQTVIHRYVALETKNANDRATTTTRPCHIHFHGIDIYLVRDLSSDLLIKLTEAKSVFRFSVIRDYMPRRVIRLNTN